MPHEPDDALEQPQYDVAFSFLSQDEAIAKEIAAILDGRLSTFVFSEERAQAEELAGRNVVDALTDVFRRRAKIVVVLYRNGWAKTPYTVVERQAIQERGLKALGYAFLLLIKLDESPIPDFLPSQSGYLHYERYGGSGAAATIEHLARQQGIVPHDESAVEMAARLAQRRQARLEEVDWLQSPDGTEAGRVECAEVLRRAWDEGRAMNSPVLPIRVYQPSSPGTVVVQAHDALVVFITKQQIGLPYRWSLLVREGLEGEEAEEREWTEEASYRFDVQDGLRGWRIIADTATHLDATRTDGRFLTSRRVVDEHLRKLLQRADYAF